MKNTRFTIKMYGTATVGTKGQIVIPSDAREELGIEPGDKLYIAGSPSKSIVLPERRTIPRNGSKTYRRSWAANNFIKSAKKEG